MLVLSGLVLNVNYFLRLGSTVRIPNYVNFTADVISTLDHLPYLHDHLRQHPRAVK